MFLRDSVVQKRQNGSPPRLYSMGYVHRIFLNLENFPAARLYLKQVLVESLTNRTNYKYYIENDMLVFLPRCV